MARLKLKQVLSNLHYNAIDDQLILSSSRIMAGQTNWDQANQTWEQAYGTWDGQRNPMPTGQMAWNETNATWEEAFSTWEGDRAIIPDFVIHGATYVTSSAYNTGSITIEGVDTFGDENSFDSIDLGEY